MAQEIWLEKYRPKTLDEVYGNTEIVDSLRVCVQHGKDWLMQAIFHI